MIKIYPTSTKYTPTRGTPGSGGLDLYTRINKSIPPGARHLVPVGIRVAIPEGYVGLIWPRSGLDVKQGLTTGAGVIDSDYRDEVFVLLVNRSIGYPASIQAGDRIAQMVVVPCMTAYTVVNELPEAGTEHAGFGSTGR